MRRADKLTTLPTVLISESLNLLEPAQGLPFRLWKISKMVSHVQRSNSGTVQTSPRAHPASYAMVYSRGYSGLDIALTAHPHLGLRKSRSILLLSLCAFMAGYRMTFAFMWLVVSRFVSRYVSNVTAVNLYRRSR